MILIINGKVLTMGKESYENGYILVEGGIIEEVGKDVEDIIGKIDSTVEIIDAKGGWVLPGFIDAHCHIGMLEEDIGPAGADLNESTDPITPHLRAIDAVNPMDAAFSEAVRAGITTVMTGPGSANVIGGQFLIMKTNGISVDEMIVEEIAAVKAALGENPKRIYNSKNKMPSTRMGTAALLRETLTKAKSYKNKKNLACSKGDNFDIDLKMEALIPVLENEIPLKIHAHRADDILTAIRIAKEFNISLTLDHCTEGHFIVDKIKNSNFPAIVGPIMSFRGKVETKNKILETAAMLSKAGVKIAIMTDHPVVSIEYLPLCAALAAKAGLGIEEALKCITINAAEILGIADRIGSIEKGKAADIAIFDGNPLEIFTNTLYTIIDGKIVYRIDS